MHRFDTPGPISVTLDLVGATVRLIAADRTDTIVEIMPGNSAKQHDVQLAESTTVAFADGTLHIRSPKSWKAYTFLGDDGSIDIAIHLPTGSRVDGKAWSADVRAEGSLGACRLALDSGDIRVATAGPLTLGTDDGDIAVEHGTGRASLITQSGTVRIRSIDGTATVENGDGDIWIGEITGDLKAYTATGDIAVDRASNALTATTDDGDIRIGDVSQGKIVLRTDDGDLEIGVRAGVAVWIDAKSEYGEVDTALDDSGEPSASDPTVTVHARTANGDIAIGRVHPDDSDH